MAGLRVNLLTDLGYEAPAGTWVALAEGRELADIAFHAGNGRQALARWGILPPGLAGRE